MSPGAPRTRRRASSAALEALAPEPLHLVPLGGCGEFGLNLCCYEYDDDLVVVDCGLMFPEDGMLGVDFVLPGFQYLQEQQHRLRAYVITHGHEDHVGALPFALRVAPAPVYGTPFTLGVVREKLAEHDPGSKVELRTLVPGRVERLGRSLTVEPVRVVHSIPDAVAVIIGTPAGSALHTGDLKLAGEGLPREGGTDLARLEALGDDDLLLMVADSTNALEPGQCPPERTVAEGLTDVFATAPGRIVVAQFASNIERLNTVLALAKRFNRHVVLEGRSLTQFVRLAEEMQLLEAPPGVRVSAEQAAQLPPRRFVAVVTGTQGEGGSVLRRLAVGDHAGWAMEPGDTLVLSSRVIPGSERIVGAMVDRFCRLGCTVVDQRSRGHVHVSGHGFREDLRQLILTCRPRCFVPVHGRYRLLVEHSEIARSAGIERVHVPDNGVRLAVSRAGLKAVGQTPSGRTMVDGKGVGDVEELVLRDRRALASTGIVVALVALVAEEGSLARDPQLTAVGVTGPDESSEVLARAARSLRDTLDALPSGARRLPGEVADVVRRELRRFFRRELARKPVVIPIVIEE